MTKQEILAAVQADPALAALLPNTQAIADALSAGNTVVTEYWLTDRGLVSDLGDLALSDSVLAKFKVAAESSISISALYNRLCTDSKGINFGDAALRAWIGAMTPDVFTEAERDALLALSETTKNITEFEVRCALLNDDGTWRV